MAIDGSFCLEFELERFLSRCPNLASIAEFDYLLKKGRTLAEEEVVNTVAELFLHPNYTIPLIGCFRAIAHKIVDRTVALLHLVPDLTSNSDDSMVEFDEDKFLRETEDLDKTELLRVIDVYVRSRRGLRLHELAVLAFSRAFDLVPSVLGFVLSYFKFAPPPFERIMTTESVSKRPMVGDHILNCVRASYRLLLAKPEVFSTFWDWSCFLNLVLQSDLDAGNNAELLKNVLDMKWCGIQILSMTLKMSETGTTNFGLGAEEAFACLMRWHEFCEDVSLEKAGWYLEQSEAKSRGLVCETITSSQACCQQAFGLGSLAVSSSKLYEIEPSIWSSRQTSWAMTSTGNPFVLTSTVSKSFEMVMLAVSQRWPVRLYGPAGSGKTALIRKLAQDFGDRVLYIHMDEQVDSKTLLGNYVCTEQPGQFRWQPGSLTQAVMNGFWVVFEDIDKAPFDVQSILLPLLEGSNSFLTGHGEAIRVDEGFRLFSTASSSKLDRSHSMEGGNSMGTLWRSVMIGTPGRKDMVSIVNAWYPVLEPLAEKLIETFETVSQLVGNQFGTSCLSCRFSLRDLLKWCKRIAALGFSFVGDGLPSYVYNTIYQEAVDVFASFSSSAEDRLTIMNEIAKMWPAPASAVGTFSPVSKPVLQELRSELRIGRITLQRTESTLGHEKKPFVEIRSSLHVLEKIACSVKFNEPVLLVGETGTGKTTLVQNLATRLGQKLTVLNLSQQSDVADLLGGFKPMNAHFICIPLFKEFENLFTSTFSSKDNQDFLALLKKFVSDKNWKMLFSGFQKGVKKIVEISRSGSGMKRKRPVGEELLRGWENFSLKLETAYAQISASAGMIFSFVEGAFVTALKNGEWILLDEVNLAPPETLQRIIGVLDEANGSLCLAERGDVEYIHRHPNFRIFACMNPATDAGKKDLPFSLRSRFTEYFVDDVLDDDDLVLYVSQYMDDSNTNKELVSKIVHFYKAVKQESEERLQDGANQKPQFSLRSLYRALEYTTKARTKFGFQKALYDGFCMFFLTLLDGPSSKLMNHWILSYLLGGTVPQQVPFVNFLRVRENCRFDEGSYVLTKSVNEHLRNLARAIFIGKYPILLQGPTSSGKTSLVRYLAEITGHDFVRINNHEHTDLQEYLGSYITDVSGKLVFHEGVLVRAVRNGYWIVLDELNLAPSDVLEALNRLLDDNRELFLPELREVIRAHPDFMLFATQNPPTFYGGRKMLSRAFRNRFVEIHVDEIPQDELSTILEKRCKIPASYSKKMVEVMKELQLHRQSSKVFAGRHGFITPRDLFRWADRFRTFGHSYEDLAQDGYYLLAERLRDDLEKRVVQDILERQLRVKIAMDNIYTQESAGEKTLDMFVSENLGKIIWTKSMWRLYFLVERCYRLREPVLLVGETGAGKTTVCQLLSVILGAKLHILNCHQYTETSDFIGGFYPVRDRSRITSEFEYLCEQLMQSSAFVNFPGDATISTDINQASVVFSKLATIMGSYRKHLVSHPSVTQQDLDFVEQLNAKLAQLYQKWQTIFLWQDGPLVHAMRNGDLFLVDEISLADDSVLERVNSVLEPERKLSLAEKGGSNLENITAHPDFFLLATMNPGGDYGKKELSPALRNRFTEIWVPPVCDVNELKSIALERFLKTDLSWMVDEMLNFWEWFSQLQTGRMLTVRDLLSWVAFINVAESTLGPEFAFLHGAFLVLLDGLSLGTSISRSDAADLREKGLSFLLGRLKVQNPSFDDSNLSIMENYGWGDPGKLDDIPFSDNMQCDNHFGIHPFYIKKGDDHFDIDGFEFLAPTTRRNALRVLRAMQLSKPVLLEGSPGVGKTSLIVALGKFSGHDVVRINLSEQTDIMDLLGSDLPIESDEGMHFAWSDGILLQALKKGSWVLLDELNLAPQSVLEGLNAILDHRAEVFIPELGHTFKCPSSFRVFACQNPSCQGGGRKGLPKSFMNRFTKVYVDELAEDDYLFICTTLYPAVPRPILSKLILFNKRLHQDIMLYHKFAQDGFPWEFNLRDVMRSCQIIQGAPGKSKFDCFLNTLYVQRMRTPADRKEVIRLYKEVFEMEPCINAYPRVQLNPQYLLVGNTCVKRNHFLSSKVSETELKILPGMRPSLEAVAHCVEHQWLCILIGPPSSGKTSLIRLLAQLTGNILNELNLSSTTDISELLGCFEQYNVFRNYRLAIARVECYINEYCSLHLESSTEVFIRRNDLITRWLTFLSSIDYSSCSFVSACLENWSTRFFGSISLLVEIIECLRLDLEENLLPLSWSCQDLDRTSKTLRKLQEDNHQRPYSGKFEWVTGPLIKAIENGEWIVLENANLCNPTVLDRINSLVEHSGSITLNECGTVNGNPVVLHPHPHFRMFLTINPSHGEVSRAMRNRGVEIYMMEPYWLLEGEQSVENDGIELKDVKRFLVLSGIPLGRIIDAMAAAHVYARHEGLHLNVSITYLELARWVQLFQRLLLRGNQALWSLQISWQHTYLSSLGESEGKDIVNHATSAYLSAIELYKYDFFQECSLCLPGGWPLALKLRDFMLYSRETSVLQNCMYLQYLGAQTASYTFGVPLDKCPMEQAVTANCSVVTYLTNMKILHLLMFPNASDKMVAGMFGQTEFDLALSRKKLWFAANWTIEQATESDLELYLLWFSQFGSQLQPFCQFFTSFLAILKQEFEHPIWRCIFRCRHELVSHLVVDISSKPIPILSLDLVDLYASDDHLKSCSNSLVNAINCIGLLRLSYQQWSIENEYAYGDKTQCFLPVLRSLRKLEEKVLDLLVESPSFDVIFRWGNGLLEDHISFWNGIVSSQFESLLIPGRSLVKHAGKLQVFCPGEVDTFLEEIRNLNRVSSWSFCSQKSLLWVYGGHPFLPSSADVYQKQLQLVELCESFWPRNMKLSEIAVNTSSIDAVVSSNPELRFLAMQGVCMSSYIMDKVDEDDCNIVEQLEEMCQMLLRRFGYEKHKLELSVATSEQSSSHDELPTCCVFSPHILCSKSGFDSWLDTLPLIDVTSFFLDVRLLQRLSKIVWVDPDAMQLALSSLSKLLYSTFNFSMTFSSRPPTDFLPHQKILWALDAWTSVNAVKSKISSFVLEMWFRWHTFLWTGGSVLLKNEKLARPDGYNILLPNMLFMSVKSAAIEHFLKSTLSIGDYSVHSLRLRVASHNLWCNSPHVTVIHDFLLSAARSLFKQIIFVHEKSFEAEKYAAIKSNFCSVKEKSFTQNDIQAIVSLVASSTHQKLTSLIDAFIEPLLFGLYHQHPSDDVIYNLGCVWSRLGGMRYHLLICCDDLDPAVKYSFKYAQLLEKIASVELEMEVRKECIHLAGCFPMRIENNQRISLLENLKSAGKRMKRQIVHRSDSGKFKKLKYECKDFLRLVTALVCLCKDVKSMHIGEIETQVQNWQDTATCFIERLSSEYSAYIDLVQPAVVAIYEMKLGLSLLLASSMRKRYLERVGHSDMDTVLETIYSYMRFPRGCNSIALSVEKGTNQAREFSRAVELLENFVTCSRDVNTHKQESVLQLKAAIHENILVRTMHSATDAHFMDNASFMLLDKIFNGFACLWMNMKAQSKMKEELQAQQFKFRSRSFKIENIIEIDISTLSSLPLNESLSEWQEMLSEEESAERNKAEEEHDTLDENWDSLQESILNHTIHIHNQLFGSLDLARPSGSMQISDADRLLSFINSYDLGTRMIKGLDGLLPVGLDARLLPEHLLRLCLEHEQKFNVSHKSDNAYNFYKDSNAHVMVKMVSPVKNLQQRILFLLNEWDNHPALLKILDVIEMILAVPLSTPLAKALSGLQFLLNRIRILHETVSKFPLSEQLEPIFDLVSSWQKLEFESWPALLDEVQAEFEINAGKLWFPLYSVLQRRHSTDIFEYGHSTIQSLNDFINTSCVGEFRKRLQLLFAFHGQISSGITQGCYSSSCQVENLKILYNIFGFYVQFLPTILEHIEANRRSVEMELKELLKLCRWDRSESFLTMENSKRTRQKLKKLIQKYTDILQQPVIPFLKQTSAQRGSKTQFIKCPNLFSDSFERNGHIVNVQYNNSQFQDQYRSLWFTDWRKKVDFILENLQIGGTAEFNFSYNFKDAEDIESIVQKCIHSLCLYEDERSQVWYTIEKIYRTAVECGELWEEEKTSLGKRRAFSDLLNLLNSSGLSKHRSRFVKEQSAANESSCWQLQPSYDVNHLLLTQNLLSSGNLDVSSFPDSSEFDWKTANEYYFKSLASVHQLRDTRPDLHNFTSEQIDRSVSYLDHLITIQQEQRATAYDFVEQLRCFKKCMLSLQNLLSSSTPIPDGTRSEHLFSRKPDVTFKCMWKQKKLLDDLCAMLRDGCLLLNTVQKSHLNTCQSVGADSKQICSFIEKFIPSFQISKDLLDGHLLGHNGVTSSEAALLHPYVVTRQMEQLLYQNFQLIREFEEHLCAFHRQIMDEGSIKEVLLSHFEEIFQKGKFLSEEYASGLQSQSKNKVEDSDASCGKAVAELETGFLEVLKKTYKPVVDALHCIGSLNNGYALSKETWGNISLWKAIFKSNMSNLQLDLICEGVFRTLQFAGEMVDHYDHRNPNTNVLLGKHLKQLYLLLDLILAFGNGLLHDFVVMHKKVAMMTHVLANIFAALYSKGFGDSAQEQKDDVGCDTTQEANGTGMGEGVGTLDVSNQITDEDQLLGTSEKPSEEQDALTDVPSKNDKGIEMEQDFAADTFSVSEESGDDDFENGEDEQLESAMGETGADSEIVDEKLWDKDDEKPSSTNEKYEPGPSIKGKDSCDTELRAKEDSSNAADETGGIDADKSGEENDAIECEEDSEGIENMEDMNVNKEDEFLDPTGLKVDEQNLNSEDEIDMDRAECADPMEVSDLEEPNDCTEDVNAEKDKSMDEALEEAEKERLVGNSGGDDTDNNHETNRETDPISQDKNVEWGATSMDTDHVSNVESTAQPKGDLSVSDLGDVTPDAKWSSFGAKQNDLAPMRGLPNASEVEIAVADSTNAGKLSDDQPKSELTKFDSSSLQKMQPNPCRDVGAALDGWKERVNVSIDIQDTNIEAPDDLIDDNADEYGYTSGYEKGTAQALGPATSDQIDRNFNGNDHNEDSAIADKKDHNETDIEKVHSETTHPLSSYASNLRNKIDDQIVISDSEKQCEGSPEIHNNHDSDSGNLSSSLVTIRRCYMSEDIHQLSKLRVSDDELGKAHNLEHVSSDIKDNATFLWRRYELITRRLTQELSEQLRLVMEPTLASRLQGDYKTGKRINMKKVIPYIASHYRKDKIWLRRTRPNKRDYQVVIAVDDSRSMLESHCGDVAIEALVTVCRAMSQLEVGNLAVASFGKKGNIRLLHDFDQPFTGETGIKMISSLTFKQENTIADEPMVDLLQYVNKKLDAAVTNARLPSGHNPLQQLVLIIADGRFHEKEHLKRCVRDILSKRRMVAFLLLDSPEESIIDLMEASFQGGRVKFSKYLDSFPFPYYVVLRNIEALPRTLADLLRQWFELMQHSKD